MVYFVRPILGGGSAIGVPLTVFVVLSQFFLDFEDSFFFESFEHSDVAEVKNPRVIARGAAIAAIMGIEDPPNLLSISLVLHFVKKFLYFRVKKRPSPFLERVCGTPEVSL